LHGAAFAFDADLFLVTIVFGFALINAVSLFSADLFVGAIARKAATDKLFATAGREIRCHGKKQRESDPAKRSCHLRASETDKVVEPSGNAIVWKRKQWGMIAKGWADAQAQKSPPSNGLVGWFLWGIAPHPTREPRSLDPVFGGVIVVFQTHSAAA